MNISGSKNVFERSGLAALSDLENIEYREIFLKLEKEQNIFLSKESEFRSSNYKWPCDPLHNFSRVWEYPYVYYHLINYLKTVTQNSQSIVVDVGSGVTFFPFSIARLGYQVICTDIDSICERDLFLACSCVPHSPGKVDFMLIKNDNIPVGDSQCDAVYCISVIEHIPDFKKLITEMTRILKPGGLCIVTCDINMKPSDGLQLDCANYKLFMSAIDANFDRVYPERTIHPVDILTTLNSPYTLELCSYGVFRTAYSLMKQKVLKPLLRHKPGKVRRTTPIVTVLGLVLRKKT